MNCTAKILANSFTMKPEHPADEIQLENMEIHIQIYLCIYLGHLVARAHSSNS